MRFMLPLAAMIAAASLVAQSPLTTVYAGGNGLGAGSTIYFNVVVNAPLTFTQIDVNSSSALGTPGTIEVRWCNSTYVGNDSIPTAWTLGGSGSVTAAGSNVPTACTLSPFTLPPGNYGMAVTFVGVGQNYTNGNGTTVPGTGTNQTYSTNELQLLAGASTGGSPALGTGAICCNPRVFNGSLYYSIGGSGTVATRTSYGQGCYTKKASVYENFATSAAFDLANSAISMLPGGGGYVLLPGISPYIAPSAAATALALTDDSETTVALPIPFPHSTGITSQLAVCSNGYVSIATGNGTGFTPTPATMLAAPQTGWWAQHDYNPAAVGSGQVKFEMVGTLACVTWDGVYDYGGTSAASANTFQFQFDCASGAVHIVFGAMSTAGNGRLVAYSAGGASMDPGSTDLSVALPSTIVLVGSDMAPLTMAASGRPVTGTSFNLVTSNIQPGTVIGATILSFTQINPGIDLGFLGAPGCSQLVSPDTTVVFVSAGASSYSQPFAIPNSPGYVGLVLYVQSAAFTSGLNSLGAVMSNGLALGVGNL